MTVCPSLFLIANPETHSCCIGTLVALNQKDMTNHLQKQRKHCLPKSYDCCCCQAHPLPLAKLNRWKFPQKFFQLRGSKPMTEFHCSRVATACTFLRGFLTSPGPILCPLSISPVSCPTLIPVTPGFIPHLSCLQPCLVTPP